MLKAIDPSKSCGPDDIPGRLLHEGAIHLSGPLTELFNMSIHQGKLPLDWKTSNITPIHKKGSRNSPSNYRPISLTSTVIKTLERIIHRKVYDHLTDHNILSTSQHGFRARHSCQTQLLETINDWAETINNHSSTHAIFLDFSKTFDSVSHQSLLLKLESSGIRGDLLDWFRAFLTGRKQGVCIDHRYSNWTRVSSGVPQGSIPSPLLFIIYINDIGSNIKSKIKLFADDSVLYRDIRTIDDCRVLQDDLPTLAHWSNTWQLQFNVSKCKVMCLSTKKLTQSINYQINNTNLEWVPVFKYLGLVIDQKLTWRDQVNHASTKATKILNLLRRNLHHATKSAKSRAFSALVRPHLEYSAPVWSPHTKTAISKLENVQKRAARWIEAKWSTSDHCWNRSYVDCRHSLSWLTLENRRRLLTCCQTFKIFNHLDCINLNEHYTLSPCKMTRSHDQSLLCKQARVNCYRYSFFINSCFLWNELPSEIVNCTSHTLFKSALRRHLLCT